MIRAPPKNLQDVLLSESLKAPLLASSDLKLVNWGCILVADFTKSISGSPADIGYGHWVGVSSFSCLGPRHVFIITQQRHKAINCFASAGPASGDLILFSSRRLENVSAMPRHFLPKIV